MSYNRFDDLPRFSEGKIGHLFYDELIYLTHKYEGETVTYIKWQDPKYKQRKNLKWNNNLRAIFHVTLVFGNIAFVGLLISMLFAFAFYFGSVKGFAIASFFVSLFVFNHTVLMVIKVGLSQFLSFYHPHVVKITRDADDGAILIEYYDNESFIHWTRVYHYLLVINTNRSYYVQNLKTKKFVSKRNASGILTTLKQAVMVGPR